MKSLLYKYQNQGDKDALHELMDEFDPLIQSEVSKYRNANIPPRILEGRAKIIFSKAAKDFDLTRDNFPSYAKKSMRSLYRDVVNLNPLYVPEQRYNKINKFMEVRDLLGEEYSIENAAKKLKLDVAEVERLEDEASLMPIINNDPAEVNLDDGDLLQHVYKLTADPLETQILDLTFKNAPQGRPFTNNEIAEQMDISPAYVRKIKDRIIQRIYEEE